MGMENTFTPPQSHNPRAPSITVGIGEYRISRSPYLLRTVLGSCVGVMIYDEELKLGGLAHVYLPYVNEFSPPTEKEIQEKRLSFADLLIPHMLKELERWHGKRSRFQVHVTGGGYVLPEGKFPNIDIGRKNLDAVRHILRKENLRGRELEIGGRSGQSVIFNLFNGGIEIRVHG